MSRKEVKEIDIESSDIEDVKKKGFLHYLKRVGIVIIKLPYQLIKFIVRSLYAIICILFICLIGGIGVATVLSAKYMPMYENACDTAYEKLSGLKDSSFRMLQDTIIYDKDGKKIGEIDAGDYLYCDITDVSKYVQNGYIATEDKRFKEHIGIDLQSLTRAALSLWKNNGEITQGGSTITQQVIKNNILSQEKSYSRKLVEVMLAPKIEQRYSKDKIMEFYVNTCYYGNRCYGIQTASKYYFGKDCKDLTLAESAMLCGVSNSPNKYNPIASMKLAKEKMKQVLENMLECKFITKEQYNKALKQKVKVKVQKEENGNQNYMMSYAVHCTAIELMKKDGFKFQYVFKNKKDETDYNKRYINAYQAKSALIRSGGFRIYTSFDKKLQKKLQDSIDKGLSAYKGKQKNHKYALQGASVCIDNRTGFVVAMVGGRGTKDEYNRAFLSKRQPGSTIKPLLDYAPAMNEGVINPSTVIKDEQVYNKTGTYSPSNSGGKYRGNVTIREGLARSLNTVAFQVYNRTGAEKSIDYLNKMHFTSLSYADNTAVALSLGGFTYGCRVVEMARGYNTLAMQGQYTTRTCLTKVEHETEGLQYDSGELVKTQTEVYSADTAFMMTDTLQGGIDKGFGTGHSIADKNMIIAGKTGTTSSNKDAWFCGYTKYYTTAVWVGYDTPKVMEGMYGGTVPAKIWKSYMDKIPANKTKADFEVPSTIMLKHCKGGTYSGELKELKIKAGKRITQCRPKGFEWFSHQNKEKYVVFQKSFKLKEEIKRAKDVLENFLDYYLNSPEDCLNLDKAYTKCLNAIEDISDEYEQSKMKKKATEHYLNLNGEIKQSWEEVIKQYKNDEKQKKVEQDKINLEQSKYNAENRLKQDRIATANWYINQLNNRQYYSSLTKLLINDALIYIERLKGYKEYASYMSKYKTAVSKCKSLPKEPDKPEIPQDSDDFTEEDETLYAE